MKKKKYRQLKGSIRIINIQRSEAEKVNLIEEGKKIGINEAIKHNEVINNNLKYKYVQQCYYQNVQYVIVKN